MKFIESLFVVLLVLSIVFSCVCVATAEEKINYGDVYSPDGKIDILDVVAILKYIAGWNLTEREFNFVAADVNCDGVVNIADAIKLLQYIAGWGWMLGKV